MEVHVLGQVALGNCCKPFRPVEPSSSHQEFFMKDYCERNEKTTYHYAFKVAGS